MYVNKQLSIGQAMRLLGVDGDTIHLLINDGDLRVIRKLGGPAKTTRDHIEACRLVLQRRVSR